MSEERELIKRHLLDLYRKAERGGYFTFSAFLGLSELSVLGECEREIFGGYSLFGGHPDCERRVARFGRVSEIGYEADFPIKMLRAEPLMQKYADRLTHRDFLGAILNLGIEREVIGDIVITDNVGYIFVLEDMSGYIAENLTRIKHTDVRLTECSALPVGELYRTEERTVQVSSERLDAVIARVFHLSREEAQSYFRKRLVFTNGIMTESTSHVPKADDVVSVRGAGRFIYRGYVSDTKKGKLNVKVEVYI